MPEYAKPMARLIEELRRLPGIGSKSAQRIAFHVLKAGTHDVECLTAALRDVKESIRLCDLCNNVTEVTPCAYCADPSRNAKLLCVIEGPEDILAIEKTGQYRGYYHVLHGALSPLHGIGPEQLRTANLVERLKSGAAEEVEVIIATNPNVEGEATASLARFLRQVVPIQGLANKRLDDGLAAYVQFRCSLIQFLQHGCGDIHVHPLDGLPHPAPIREKTRHIFAPVRYPGDGLG